MSFRESRAVWRKLWRKEPPGRIELSCMARGVTLMLIREAADDGCVGPIDDRYHRASHLARRLGIRPQDRRAFNRTIDELLAYDGDRDPLRLVLRDDHFYLTGFEQMQARCKPGVSPGASEVYDQVPQESDKPAESLDTETAKPTEDRRKKKDIYIATAEKEPEPEADPLPDPDPVANGQPAFSLPGEYRKRWEARYPGQTRNLDQPKYVAAFTEAERQARAEAGDWTKTLAGVLDRFFADDSQKQWGSHSPKTLSTHLGRYLKLQRAEDDAERRIQAEYAHTQRELAKCEAAKRGAYVPTPEEMAALNARRDRKAAEQREKQGGPNPLANVIDLQSVVGRGG